MEKKMDHEMESGVIKWLFRDPSIQIIPTLGPKVCKNYDNSANNDTNNKKTNNDTKNNHKNPSAPDC